MSREDHEDPILHVIVVGFHHKKGCLVEYSFPPLIDGESCNSNELPDPWKHLPSLALPDGAHNYEQDTIYFHLPSLEVPRNTVYGISCYRQMNAEQLINRSSDITRGTVQKSVCVLSRLPLYGLIQAKLELITHAYFSERDFSKVTLLEDTYRNLNACLTKDMLDGQQAFLGLSARELILHFRHKVLVLFKLVLLERKVLFYKSPVKDLCSVVLTLCSLFPGIIEKGLSEAATSVNAKLFSPELRLSNEHDYLEVHYNENNNDVPLESDEINEHSTLNVEKSEMEYTKDPDDPRCSEDFVLENRENRHESVNGSFVSECSGTIAVQLRAKNQDKKSKIVNESSQNYTSSEPLNRLSQGSCDNDGWEKIDPSINDAGLEFIPSKAEELVSVENLSQNIPSVGNCELDEEDQLLSEIDELLDSKNSVSHLSLKFKDDISSINSKDSSEFSMNDDSSVNSLTLRPSKSSLLSGSKINSLVCGDDDHRRWSFTTTENAAKERTSSPTYPVNADLLNIELDDCGLPMALFTKGSLCHPYLSLPFLDLLSDVNVRSFIVGATNVLFKQKKHLFDAIVEIDEGKVNIEDAELRKQLHLTTEDLRFADFLVRNVLDDNRDIFLDGTGWEGGDEWLRAQFKLYLLSLLRTSQLEASSKEIETFNSSFISVWKTTHNYKMWSSGNYKGILEINPGHPFHGQLSMSDMKLRLSHTMQNSERGRRLNQAVVSTSKVVTQTGKAVGGAITSAKSVVTSWWSHFGTSQMQGKQITGSSSNLDKIDNVNNDDDVDRT